MEEQVASNVGNDWEKNTRSAVGNGNSSPKIDWFIVPEWVLKFVPFTK